MILLGIVIILFSCSNDNTVENIQPIEELIKPIPIEDGGIEDKAALIIDGVAYYVGIGYDPRKQRLYAPAIDNIEMITDTNVPNALEVDVVTIRNNHELENFVKKTETRNLRVFFGLFGIKKIKEITERVRFTEETVSVIARISVQNLHYSTGPEPFLNDRAVQLLSQGRINDFYRKYSGTFISDQITGGDVYYVYNYKYESTNQERRSNFDRKIQAYVKELFGQTPGVILTQEDRSEINRSVETYMVSTNIVGYTPMLINNVGQVNPEIARIQNYLTTNPQNAAAIEMELKSFADLYDFQDLRKLFKREEYFYTNWIQWQEIRSMAQYLYTIAPSDKKAKAINLLNRIIQEENKALELDDDSFSPYFDPYNDLVNEFDLFTYEFCKNPNDPDTCPENTVVWRKDYWN